MGAHKRYVWLLHCTKIGSDTPQVHDPMPELTPTQSIELGSDLDTVPTQTSTGASKWPSGNQAQNPSPSLWHDQTSANVDEVSGTDMNTSGGHPRQVARTCYWSATRVLPVLPVLRVEA